MTFEATLQAEHKARLARFAQAAKHPKIKNRAVTHVVPAKVYGAATVIPFDETAWLARQRKIPIVHKQPWFEIIEGPTEFETKIPAPVRIEKIQQAVCARYKINWRDMLSNRRTQSVARPRMVAVYLCKQLTTRSLQEIGRRFGDRDHTTILHSVSKISRLIGEDMIFAAEVETLRKQCEAA